MLIPIIKQSSSVQMLFGSWLILSFQYTGVVAGMNINIKEDFSRE